MENFSRPLSPSVGGAARKPMSNKLMSKLGMLAVEPAALTASEEAARRGDIFSLSSSTSSDESSSDSGSSSSDDGEEARHRRKKEKKRKRDKVDRRKKHKKEVKKKKQKQKKKNKHKKHGKRRQHKRQRSGAEAADSPETGPRASTASGGDAEEPERAEWPAEVRLFLSARTVYSHARGTTLPSNAVVSCSARCCQRRRSMRVGLHDSRSGRCSVRGTSSSA